MSRVPAQVTELLADLTRHLPVVLGRNLFGFYLYGSLTQKAFNSKRSDVDCIVVTNRDLSETQFRKLSAWLAKASELNPWFRRLQMTLLTRTKILKENVGDCTYQFGVLYRSGSDGNPIIWINILKSGVVLYGPKPETFVPPITSEILFKALEREVGYLREEICDNPDSQWRDVPYYRVYAILTLCRILYSYNKGTIVSKKVAGKWAIKYLPVRWNKIILQAMAGDEAALSSKSALASIRRFIDFADSRLRSAG